MELARRDLAKLWETLQQLSPEWQRDMLLAYVPQLVVKYGDLAAQAAYEWYMRVRGESVPDPWEYDLSDSFPGDGIDKTIRWQAGHPDGPQTMQAFLVGDDALGHVFGRETIARLCEHDPSGTPVRACREARATCAFCTMLCSRGWVYRSEKTAIRQRLVQTVPRRLRLPDRARNGTGTKLIEGYDPDRMYSEYMHARNLIENGGLDDDTYRMIKATTKGNPDNPNDPNTLVYLMRRLLQTDTRTGMGVPRTVPFALNFPRPPARVVFMPETGPNQEEP